jgi:predicted dehydrogenase
MPAQKPRIKYAQIGVGHAHAAKLGVYRQSEDYEVVGICEPDEKLRRQAEGQPVYRDLQWLTLQQLLNLPGLQVVGVETEVRHLLDVAEKSVEAGKHVHIDKPAGTSLPQFRRILDAAARQHLAVQLGYMYRYNPAVVMLRDFLRRGWLGEPFELHAVMSKQVDAGTRRELAEFSGGSMFELGCHLIDLVVALLGPPERVHPFVRHSSKLDDGLADNMLAVFEYPRATATVRSSVNEVEGFARRHLALCGSEGTFHIQPLDSPSARLALGQPRGDYRAGYQDVTFPQYERYVDDAADLARIVRHEKDPGFSYEHDYQVQRAVLEASAMPVD